MRAVAQGEMAVRLARDARRNGSGNARRDSFHIDANHSRQEQSDLPAFSAPPAGFEPATCGLEDCYLQVFLVCQSQARWGGRGFPGVISAESRTRFGTEFGAGRSEDRPAWATTLPRPWAGGTRGDRRCARHSRSCGSSRGTTSEPSVGRESAGLVLAGGSGGRYTCGPRVRERTRAVDGIELAVSRGVGGLSGSTNGGQWPVGTD